MPEELDIERLEATIRTRYPYPLAATFIRAYYEAPEPVLALDYLMNLYEVTLKYLTSIALAQYFNDRIDDPKINQSLLTLQRPSLGHWQGWLRDILDLYERQKRQILVPELAEFYGQKHSGVVVEAFNILREIRGSGGAPSNRTVVTTQQFFDELGSFRNQRAHRPIRAADMERAGNALGPAWRKLFQELAFVADYRLIYVREVVVTRDPRQLNNRRYGHRLTYLMGDLPRSQNNLQTTDGEPLNDRELYLLGSGTFNPLLSLHPFWIFRPPESGSREEAFVLNLSNGSELEYISYQSGDRFNPTEYVDYMQSLLHSLHLNTTSTPQATEPDDSAAALEEQRRQHEQELVQMRAQMEAERQAREEAEQRARNEAARLAQTLAEQQRLAERARQEEELRAREEAEREKRQAAEQQAQRDAELKANQEAERRIKEEQARAAQSTVQPDLPQRAPLPTPRQPQVRATMSAQAATANPREQNSTKELAKQQPQPTWLIWVGSLLLLFVLGAGVFALATAQHSPIMPTVPPAPTWTTAPAEPTATTAMEFVQPTATTASAVSSVRVLQGHSGGVSSVVFSPDGKTLASGSLDRTMKLWRVSDGTLLQTIVADNHGVRSVAFSPDGQTIVAGSSDGGSNGSIKLWRIGDSRLLQTFPGVTADVRSVAFSPDGQTIAAGLADGLTDGMIKLWRVSDGVLLQTFPNVTNVVLSIAFSPDGQTIAAGLGDKTIKLWRVSDGILLEPFPNVTNVVQSVAFSPDGQTIAAGFLDQTKLWRVSDRVLLQTINLDNFLEVDGLAFSPDGQTLGVGSEYGPIKLLRTSDGLLLRTLTGHKKFVFSVAFSPDGQILASGSSDNTIRLWSLH